jgi:ankyrin repeat protein
MSYYKSLRDVGEVLSGEDTAGPLLEESSSGNDTTLQRLLSEPQWIKTMLEEPDVIYSAPSWGAGETKEERQVLARPRLNIERCFMVAAKNGHAAVVSTLLAFAKHQDVDASNVMTRQAVNEAIGGGHAAVFKAMASAEPSVINFELYHGARPLYEAVRRRKPELVATLLELGADPLHAKEDAGKLSYHTSLMSHAAHFEGPHVMEMLLERGVPIALTGALHSAAKGGRLDTMRVLMQHGADVNEIISTARGRTPLHFAATKGQVNAMKLLEEEGARSDMKDADGKTAAQLLEEA